MIRVSAAGSLRSALESARHRGRLTKSHDSKKNSELSLEICKLVMSLWRESACAASVTEQ